MVYVLALKQMLRVYTGTAPCDMDMDGLQPHRDPELNKWTKNGWMGSITNKRHFLHYQQTGRFQWVQLPPDRTLIHSSLRAVLFDLSFPVLRFTSSLLTENFIWPLTDGLLCLSPCVISYKVTQVYFYPTNLAYWSLRIRQVVQLRC